MELQTFETYLSVNERQIKDKMVVIIDTLRATSVITTALYNGAKEVIPVAEIEEAVNFVKNFGREGYLLGGERNTFKIDGFDLSNSPLEYTKEVVQGKTVILTTTNGTRALKKVSANDDVILGCLLNAGSIAEYIAQRNKDVAIVCSGTEGKFSIDDIVTAGVIFDKLNKYLDFDSDDLTKASYQLYKPFSNDITKIIELGTHYKNLKKQGFDKDLEFCLSIDKYNIIPRYKDGVVRVIADF